MKTIKTFEEWEFSQANNQDLPATELDKIVNPPYRKDPESEKTLIFTPDDEEEYPYKRHGKTHGIESHAIKHLFEFERDFYKKLIEDARDYLYPYIDENMKILDSRGFVILDITEYEDIDEMSPYNIINALDFINDKYYLHEELSDVERKLLKNVIVPIRDEYWKIINRIHRQGVGIRDYRKDMGNIPVFFPVQFRDDKGNNREYINYYDPMTKGIMATSNNKEYVYTLFKITSRSIYEYFATMKPGSKKPKPNTEILGFLRNFAK